MNFTTPRLKISACISRLFKCSEWKTFIIINGPFHSKFRPSLKLETVLVFTEHRSIRIILSNSLIFILLKCCSLIQSKCRENPVRSTCKNE